MIREICFIFSFEYWSHFAHFKAYGNMRDRQQALKLEKRDEFSPNDEHLCLQTRQS